MGAMTRRTTIGVDLGPLHGPLVASAAANGRTLSAELRAALAAYLGVAEPELKAGNPAIGELSARANAARWGTLEDTGTDVAE